MGQGDGGQPVVGVVAVGGAGLHHRSGGAVPAAGGDTGGLFVFVVAVDRPADAVTGSGGEVGGQVVGVFDGSGARRRVGAGLRGEPVAGVVAEAVTAGGVAAGGHVIPEGCFDPRTS